MKKLRNKLLRKLKNSRKPKQRQELRLLNRKRSNLKPNKRLKSLKRKRRPQRRLQTRNLKRRKKQLIRLNKLLYKRLSLLKKPRKSRRKKTSKLKLKKRLIDKPWFKSRLRRKLN